MYHNTDIATTCICYSMHGQVHWHKIDHSGSLWQLLSLLPVTVPPFAFPECSFALFLYFLIRLAIDLSILLEFSEFSIFLSFLFCLFTYFQSSSLLFSSF